MISPRQADSIIRRPSILAFDEAPKRILCVAPHPDDESLGCGGTLAAASEAGGEICVTLLTAGEVESEPDWHASGELASERLDEFEDALTVLGADRFEILDGADRAVSAQIPALTQGLSFVLDRFKPDIVLTPHGNDAHADHRAAAKIAYASVARTEPRPHLFAFEIWSPLEASHVVDITAFETTKRRALDCYKNRFVRNDLDNAILALNRYRAQCVLLPPGSVAEAYRQID